jgi:hypothetical protein
MCAVETHSIRRMMQSRDEVPFGHGMTRKEIFRKIKQSFKPKNEQAPDGCSYSRIGLARNVGP